MKEVYAIQGDINLINHHFYIQSTAYITRQLQLITIVHTKQKESTYTHIFFEFFLIYIFIMFSKNYFFLLI